MGSRSVGPGRIRTALMFLVSSIVFLTSALSPHKGPRLAVAPIVGLRPPQTLCLLGGLLPPETPRSWPSASVCDAEGAPHRAGTARAEIRTNGNTDDLHIARVTQGRRQQLAGLRNCFRPIGPTKGPIGATKGPIGSTMGPIGPGT